MFFHRGCALNQLVLKALVVALAVIVRQKAVPKISQATLAEMVGTTRSRVNFFMNKFKRLGFVEYKDGLKVHNSLVTIVLHD